MKLSKLTEDFAFEDDEEALYFLARIWQESKCG